MSPLLVPVIISRAVQNSELGSMSEGLRYHRVCLYESTSPLNDSGIKTEIYSATQKAVAELSLLPLLFIVLYCTIVILYIYIVIYVQL